MDQSSQRNWMLHTSAWSAMSQWQRFRALLAWRLGALRVALFGGMTPGERYLLGLLSESRAQRRKRKGPR